MSTLDDIRMLHLERFIRIFKAIISFSTPATIIVSIAVVVGMIQMEAIAKKQYIGLISESIQINKVNRKAVLNKFFKKYNSPLEANVDTFIEVADKYGIDYRLLPAISCIESSCGKKMIPGSYNPFGWGIYGNHAIYFKNFDEAITTVAAGLSKSYFSKGYDTPEKIAPIYTPPAHGHWLSSVRFFIKQMDTISQTMES